MFGEIKAKIDGPRRMFHNHKKKLRIAVNIVHSRITVIVRQGSGEKVLQNDRIDDEPEAGTKLNGVGVVNR